VDEALGGLISRVIAQREFQGKAGSSVLLHTQGKLRAERVLVIGLGKQEEFGLESVRAVSGEALRVLRRHGCRRGGTILHGAGGGGLGAGSSGSIDARIGGRCLGRATPSSWSDTRCLAS
jgi:leucyl aminopeptidase